MGTTFEIPVVDEQLPHSVYAWVITKVTDDDDKEYIGTAGPRTASDELVEKAKKDGQAFRLLDDDKVVVAHGKFIIDPDVDEDDLDGDEEFGPLNDFGEGNWGCTEIQYWSRPHEETHGGWKTL